MKKIFFIFLTLAITSTAGAVTSTSQELVEKPYSKLGITVEQLCKDNIPYANWGKTSTIYCRDNSDGTVTIAGTGRNGESVSVVANAADQTVFEVDGWDETYQYQNDQGQKFLIKFYFVTSGVKRVVDGAMINGSFDGDAPLRADGKQIRVSKVK